MPGLSYPYRFQCVRCGERLKIERSDAEDVSDDPDSVTAVTLTLGEHGWERSSEGVRCPSCATSAD